MGLSTLRSGDALRLSTIPASVLSNSWIRKSGRLLCSGGCGPIPGWAATALSTRISFEGLLYDGKNPLPLCFRGTTFQSAVWQALLRIAPGETMTYAEVAAAVGCPWGCPASGVGHRGEQIGRGRTVPPRRVRRRRWRRIPLGPGAEEGDSGLGADGHVGGITALPQQDAAKTADGLSGVAGLFIFVRPEHVAV